MIKFLPQGRAESRLAAWGMLFVVLGKWNIGHMLLSSYERFISMVYMQGEGGGEGLSVGEDGVVEKIVQRPKALDPQMLERVRSWTVWEV